MQNKSISNSIENTKIQLFLINFVRFELKPINILIYILVLSKTPKVVRRRWYFQFQHVEINFIDR